MMNDVRMAIVLTLLVCALGFAGSPAVSADGEYLLRLYWGYYYDDPGTEMIEFRIYDEDGDYKVELTELGDDFWNKDQGNGQRGEISSFWTSSDHPAQWWMYDGLNCTESTLLYSGTGSREQMGDHNDKVSSLRVICPDDKPLTLFSIYEHSESSPYLVENRHGSC